MGTSPERRRRWRWGAGIVALAGVVSVAGLPWMASRIIGAMAGRLLRDAGFSQAEVVVDRLGWADGAGTITLDAGGRLGRAWIEVRHDLSNPLRPRVTSVAIRGLRLAARLDDTGRLLLADVPITGLLSQAVTTDALPALPAVPVERIELADGELMLSLPGGKPARETAISLRGRWEWDKGWHLTAEFRTADGLAGQLDAGGMPPPSLSGGAGSDRVKAVLTLRSDDLAAAAARFGVALPVAGQAALALDLSGRLSDLRGAGFPGALDVRGTLTLTGSGLTVAGMVEQGSLDLAGQVSLSGGALRFQPRDCIRIGTGTIRLAAVEIRTPPRLCVSGAAGRPFLEAALSGARTGWLVAHPRLGPEPGRDRLPLDLAWRRDDGTALVLSGTLAAIEAVIDRDHAGTLRLEARLAGRRLELPGPGIVGDGVTGTVAFDSIRPEPWHVHLDLATLRAGGEPPLLAPLAVTGTARIARDGSAAFQATGRGADGVLTVRADGRHDGTAGTGHVRLTVPRLTLKPDRTPPGRLFPVLAGHLDRMAGTLGLNGRIGWDGKGNATTRAELLLQDVAVDTPSFSVAGINGVLRATRLLPLTVPPGQELAVGVLDVGLPLTGGLVRVGLRPGYRLDIDRAEWQWANGVVRTAPFEMSLTRPEGLVMLEAEGLDLQEVLNLVAVEGLSATGQLYGRLPVRIRGSRVAIEDGVLEAAAPGTLRYDPAQPPAFLKGDPGSSTALLMGALANFHYDALRMTVDGAAGGESRLRLAIRGSNPDFYGGYPVALNLNVTGALDTILRSGFRTYRIPDAVRERMMQFGRQGQ